MTDNNLQVLAFYLPQYHPTEHNNEWWGEGFTEWTNVAKAKPLFRGHYQPKIPADLGFYDLRMSEIKEKQVKLAKEAGVTGFCYYHYWFGDGHQELELPFNQVVDSGKPDFPFCLCWANESWYKKFWNADGAVGEKKVLAEQKYLGHIDNLQHFEVLKKAFLDDRYIKVDDRLLFMIYKPLEFVGIEAFIKDWNEMARQIGLKGFYFVGYSLNAAVEHDAIREKGFDAVCSCHLGYGKQSKIDFFLRKIISVVTNTPRRFSYKKMISQLLREEDFRNDVFPTMLPNWDHTPRSGKGGYVYTGATPELFQIHAEQVLSCVLSKPKPSQICFIKSWNEWGEGNYLEPDLKYRKKYINSLRQAIKRSNSNG